MIKFRDIDGQDSADYSKRFRKGRMKRNSECFSRGLVSVLSRLLFSIRREKKVQRSVNRTDCCALLYYLELPLLLLLIVLMLLGMFIREALSKRSPLTLRESVGVEEKEKRKGKRGGRGKAR